MADLAPVMVRFSLGFTTRDSIKTIFRVRVTTTVRVRAKFGFKVKARKQRADDVRLPAILLSIY